jgi:uncharacterized protein GlcG (DUF336 family)
MHLSPMTKKDQPRSRTILHGAIYHLAHVVHDRRAMSLPTYEQVRAALVTAQKSNNGGLGFQMWAVVVARNGAVATVTYSGTKLGDQWPGSRVIAATKANTANALSLDALALSTANLYSAVQPGGTLFGLQETSPVNTHAAYGGDPDKFGTPDDCMVGKPIGGVNVFGGGLALYDTTGKIIGGLGVSGDLSCADHNICWKIRHLLELDYLPAGVDPVKHAEGTDDNIVYDINKTSGKSKSGWGHPTCSDTTKAVSKSLPAEYSVRVAGRGRQV